MSDFAFRADLAALDDVIGRIVAFERRAGTITEQVDRDVSRLHVDWSGRAADEHLDAHRRWRDGAAQMHEAVTRLRSAVTTAHGNYTAAVGAGAAMWG